jgi:hypothetical protein
MSTEYTLHLAAAKKESARVHLEMLLALEAGSKDDTAN